MSLELQDIRRAFGAVRAVDGVSLDVEAGEILCLVGPSGCGKTTLLRVAGGFEPHEGSVRLNGELLAGPGRFTPPELRPIGFVFQDYVLFPHLTALENTAFGLHELEKSERQARAAAELFAVGLGDLAQRHPHQLSGGQQQRVALARAFVRRPRAMLLDEPFSSIDPALRRKLREEFRLLLKSSGAATVLVTHDAEEALALGDRIALMRAGRIIDCGAPADFFFRPRTIDAAMMFAGAQRLAGAVKDGRVATEFGDAEIRAPEGPKTVVALPGALAGAVRTEGEFEVTDCRFDPPAFTATILGPSGAVAQVGVAEPAVKGARMDVALDPGLLRVFPA